MTSSWWKRREDGATPLDEPGGRQRARCVALALVLAGALGTIGGFTPAAAAAPTPVSCGSTITASGSYVLAADCAGGIVITASDVTLDLNGHKANTVIAAGASLFGTVSDVTIEGPGKVSGGVFFDVRVTGSTISGVTVTGGFGIDILRGGSNTVSGNTIKNSSFGIFLDGLGGTSDNTITNNTISNNSNDGIAEFSSFNNTITNNTINNNGSNGILADQSGSNLITNNTINNNGSDGIVALRGLANTITNNTTNNNGSDGIDLATGEDGNTVSGNTAQGNTTYDLFDENGCGSNTWTGNTFKTANLTCIH